ncbi:MAG: hypothetical protein LC794_03435 [Acidobacteria bacterium]|nr:hypothetical protein [Acidobacteriota bacterium]
MTTSAPTSAPTDTTERGYQWYLANLDEIRHIIETDTRLNILRAIETDLDLPLGTAVRFEEFYSQATTVSPHEEERYAITWDAYHAALYNDPHLSYMAHAYHENTSPPIHQCIDDTGTFIF